MKIKVLPDLVINQIAAGEVVERPASVVRELVDNAVDAGASEILVEISSGGQTLVRVVDNGSGMSRDDALLAFERHATSKLSDATDLLSIGTMGFRGEALPSIAAVSKIILKTRSPEDSVATQIEIVGGILKNVSSVASSVGTEIVVRNLFFNTPARRKFLKQPSTEESKVKQWLLNASISRPQIHFRLRADERDIVNLPPRDTSIARAREIFKTAALKVRESGIIAVDGLLAHPDMAQNQSSALVLLVNGRLVSDRMLLKAVREGFESALKEREFPLGFIHVMLPPSEVDVNVHPQKSEIRFRAPQDVFLAVRSAVSKSLSELRGPISRHQWNSTGANQGTVSRIEGTGQVAQASFGALPATQGIFTLRRNNPEPPTNYSTSAQFDSNAAVAEPMDATRYAAQEFRFSSLRYLGQALECYLFCESLGKVYVVDMHAAHERCNYNLVRQAFRDRPIQAQQLLVPLAIELHEQGVRRCVALEVELRKAGFEFEVFGDQTILLRAIPSFLIGGKLKELFRELADDFDEESVSAGALSEAIDKISARIACHASIRSGKRMSSEEAYALFDLLDQSQMAGACPHGRPVIVEFSQSDIEQWFGRDH